MKTLNKKGQMQVFLALFSLIMGIGIVIAIYNVLSFEMRAKNMMDAAIDAQYFRKDYMLAMLTPVQNMTICHKTLMNTEECRIYVSTVVEASNEYFYYPLVSVEIQDPHANITTKLGVEVLNTATKGLVLKDMKEESVTLSLNAMQPQDCWIQGRLKTCKYVCKSPIQVTKRRQYNSTYGMYIDQMSITQSLGDQCLT